MKARKGSSALKTGSGEGLDINVTVDCLKFLIVGANSHLMYIHVPERMKHTSYKMCRSSGC